MPTRLIRAEILDSERVARLDWAAEVFYRRVMSVADDYGRYEANQKTLRAKCYPQQVDDVRVADIARWLAACQTAGLILLYEVDGKEYLEILRFGQQQRSKSKCPPPPESASKCLQVPASAHLGVSESVSGVEGVSVVDKEKGSRKRKPGYDATGYEIPDWLDKATWEKWCGDRKARGKPITEAGAAQQVLKLEVYRMSGIDPVTVLNHAIESGHQGLFYPLPGVVNGKLQKTKHGAAAAAIFDHTEQKDVVNA
ncbi:MAG: hypothetical protein V4614_15035 [Pseudomonadota bacterium]